MSERSIKAETYRSWTWFKSIWRSCKERKIVPQNWSPVFRWINMKIDIDTAIYSSMVARLLENPVILRSFIFPLISIKPISSFSNCETCLDYAHQNACTPYDEGSFSIFNVKHIVTEIMYLASRYSTLMFFTLNPRRLTFRKKVFSSYYCIMNGKLCSHLCENIASWTHNEMESNQDIQTESSGGTCFSLYQWIVARYP